MIRRGMPPVSEQLAMPGSITTPDFSGARLLLKPGRKYDEAVTLFQPYDRMQEPYPDVRTAAANLINRVKDTGEIRKLYLYVNNRLEGNALLTILAILGQLHPQS